MKKITLEEFEKLNLKKPGRTSLINQAILALKDGEMLFFSKEEWKLKTSPPTLINRSKNHPRSILKGIKIWTRTAKEGWVIGKG